MRAADDARADGAGADGAGADGAGADGGSAAGRNARGTRSARTGPRSARSCGSSGISSGMSGYCELAKDHEEQEREGRDALLRHQSQSSLQRILGTSSPTEAAKRRQEVLWTTLSDLGIRPKSEASNEHEREGAYPML